MALASSLREGIAAEVSCRAGPPLVRPGRALRGGFTRAGGPAPAGWRSRRGQDASPANSAQSGGPSILPERAPWRKFRVATPAISAKPENARRTVETGRPGGRKSREIPATRPCPGRWRKPLWRCGDAFRGRGRNPTSRQARGRHRTGRESTRSRARRRRRNARAPLSADARIAAASSPRKGNGRQAHGKRATASTGGAPPAPSRAGRLHPGGPGQVMQAVPHREIRCRSASSGTSSSQSAWP